MNQNMGSLQVSHRPMTMADLERVMAIEAASFPTPWPVQAFIYEIRRQQGSICWVAEVADHDMGPKVVGSIVIWLFHHKAHIGTLSVHPAYRRRGIAQYLLSHALLESLRLGSISAFLEVRKGNHIAQNLYKKFGFSVTDERDDYYQDTHEDALVMTLSSLDEAQLVELGDCGYH